MKKRRKIDLNTVALVIVCIPILLVVVLGVCWVVIIVSAGITHSGYVGNVNELTGRYGLNGDIFNIQSDGRFYYETQYDRFYYDVRTFEIYGRISQAEIKKIVSLDWDVKYVVRSRQYEMVPSDLPPDIYNNMFLDSRGPDERWKWFGDKKIFLCFAETKNYNVILIVGTQSGTMIMKIYQYPSGKKSFNTEASPIPPDPDIFPVVTAADLADPQQLDSKE